MGRLVQLQPAGPRLPVWLRKGRTHFENVHNLKTELRRLRLHTVCESARCPNLHECFDRGAATFMILGNLCTRGCGFCAVPKSRHPGVLDPEEPAHVARMAQTMRLRYVVITSVNRDDLEDGGSAHFAETVREVKRALPEARVEVLTPDFCGNFEAVARVLDAAPHVFNHNMETVPRLYRRVRPQADYKQSLNVLRFAKSYRPEVLTKSGAMLGLSETAEEVEQLLRDLRAADVDVATLGQYLQPARRNLPVSEYVTPERFEAYRAYGLTLAFKMVFSGPLVRSLLHGGSGRGAGIAGVNLALSAVSAVLLILAFPPLDWFWLAPVALAPLLIGSAREASWKRRFLNGWAAGFVFWFGVCLWIQFVLEVHGGLGRWLAWVTFFLFAILKGLHMAVFATLAGRLMHKPWAIPAVAALWTGIERTHEYFGFAWLDLGNAGIGMPALMRLAPITGVYGLSFVFALLACALAVAALARPRRELAWLLLLVPVIVPVLPALPAPVPGTESVRVVQPNIDTEAEWTTESLRLLEQQMAILSRTQSEPLIVWPEAPAPFDPAGSAFHSYLAHITHSSQAHLLLGGVSHTPQGDPLNSAFLVDPQGTVLDRYDKIKLVPFGEFVPPPFGWVNRITKEAGDFVPGNRIVVFQANGHRLGAFICYESAFPDLVRQFARDGGEVLMNLSNDGYFGHSAAYEQHLELVRMRAAENRRWILRATNDGITAMIDPAGRVTKRLPAHEELGTTMSYGYVQETTPYTRHGDWFAWGCLILGLAAIL